MTATAANVATMAAVIRRARDAGVRVRLVEGWRNRGRPYSFRPGYVFEHHDASPASSGEDGALGIIVAGRSDLPGPLAQFQFPRCLDDVPTVYVVAAGLANHAGAGGPTHGIPADVANTYAYGLEVANNGLGEPYTPALTYAILVVEAALLDVLGVSTSHLLGHKEWAPTRKIDPRLSMDTRRGDVADTRELAARGALTYAGDTDTMPTADEIARAVLNFDLTPGVEGDRLTVRNALLAVTRGNTADAARDRRLLTALEALPARIEAELGDGDAVTDDTTLTVAEVRRATETALRRVLGSLDNPTTQGQP